MNMARNFYDDADRDLDYQVDVERRDGKDKNARARRMQYSRSSRPSVMHNGIHRRRNKRFAW